MSNIAKVAQFLVEHRAFNDELDIIKQCFERWPDLTNGEFYKAVQVAGEIMRADTAANKAELAMCKAAIKAITNHSGVADGT